MRSKKPEKNRRDFIKMAGLSSLPLIFPGTVLASSKNASQKTGESIVSSREVNFIYDSPFYEPEAYVQLLADVQAGETIQPDFYGKGGPTTRLEKEFAELTGKEKAIYLPTGTMANQLALRLLSGEKTKVLVPENSHIYRDEADAAQSVHQKRLIPTGKNKPYITLDDVKETMKYYNEGEVYKSGWGCLSIENPVRRASGAVMPLAEIQKIRNYCVDKGIPMHLDGARLHIASAFSGVSVKTYCSFFDTVYISLYKYLNAAGGAILCGDNQLISQVEHLIKILGGTVFQTWPNTAIALHYLPEIDKMWKEIEQKGSAFIAELNKIEGLQIDPVENGSNIFNGHITASINKKRFTEALYSTYNIWINNIENNGHFLFTLNESITNRTNEDLLNCWKTTWKSSLSSK